MSLDTLLFLLVVILTDFIALSYLLFRIERMLGDHVLKQRPTFDYTKILRDHMEYREELRSLVVEVKEIAEALKSVEPHA